MLGKLLKYELRGTSHYFLPIFAGVLVFSLLNRLYGALLRGPEWINVLLISVEVILICALVVMILVITIQRFYKNLLGNEGYLMFTLPVSTHDNILAKLIIATFWNVAGLLIVALSIIIMIWQEIDLSWFFREAWLAFYHAVGLELGLSPVLMLLEWLVVALLSVASSVLSLYLAMAIGQLVNEHKFLASFGAYIALSIGESIIVSTLVQIVMSLPHEWIAGFGGWVESLSPAGTAQLITLLVALGTIITGGIYYFFTHKLLHKKLNLT